MIHHRPSLRSDMTFLNDIIVFYELAEIIPNILRGHIRSFGGELSGGTSTTAGRNMSI
jgi:hypothetical protein